MSSFRKQLSEQWVSILIEVFIALFVFVAGIYFSIVLHNIDTKQHDNEVKQKNTPLFKYNYDQINKIISIYPGDDFSSVLVVWLIPEIGTATSTVIVKNSLAINDITERVISSGITDFKFDSNPFSNNFEAYLRCIILNQFGLETKDILEGFPVGVEIHYVVRGDTSLKINYDLLLLRSFDKEPLQVYTFPNLAESQMKEWLLEKGNKRFKQIFERISYDKNNAYLGQDETCNQTTERFFQKSLKN